MASDFKGFGDPRKDVHWHGERVLFHSDFSQCLQIPELKLTGCSTSKLIALRMYRTTIIVTRMGEVIIAASG